MTETLKPCPFCGGKPYLANVAMAGCAYVVCTDCRMQSDDGSQDRVTAAWNTRATPAAMTPEVRAVVDLLREARDDLEAYVCCDYPQHLRDQYPSVARQYYRDMELCRRIDAALAALRAGGRA